MKLTSFLKRQPMSVTQRPGQMSGDRRVDAKGTGREWSALGWRVLGLPRLDTLLDSRKGHWHLA